MKNLILIAFLLAGANAHAFGSHGPVLKTLYTCFNQAQLTDAPAVTILENAGFQQFVQFETRGQNSLVALHAADEKMIDGEVLEGSGVRVYEKNGIEQPPAGASVVVTGLGLTYNCSEVGALVGGVQLGAQ